MMEVEVKNNEDVGYLAIMLFRSSYSLFGGIAGHFFQQWYAKDTWPYDAGYMWAVIVGKKPL